MADEGSGFARRRVRRDRRRPAQHAQETRQAPAASAPSTADVPLRPPGVESSAVDPSVEPVVDPSVEERPVPRPPRAPASRTQRRDADRGDRVERGLRGLVGSGPSQVGVSGAMRARDASRPTAEDMAAAERELVIVRRHYVPPDQLSGVPHHPGGRAPADS